MADKPLTPQQAQAEELAFSASQLQSFDLEIAYEAKRAFQKYYWRQHYFYGNTNDDILRSTMIRVDQTILLLKKTLELLDKFLPNKSEQWFLEAQTYIESFYYLAFTAACLLE